ncbi:hypothetical protein L7F22_007406 [Adiantum nelumboides]|nr:hypothetical protein [Adiantum nelumboides]
MADKGKVKLLVEESSSSTRKHRRETAAADTQFMASARTAARTARAPRPSMTAEEQEENDLFTAQLMSMMGTFEQLAKNPRMQKLLKTKDYRTGSQVETSQQATSRQRQVTEPVERVPTVVTGPVQHFTQAQDPARDGHRSNEQSTHPTIPMHTSFPGYFGGGSVFQSMIIPSPGFQGYMPSTGNPMYDNIDVQPGFQIVPGSLGMAGTDLGMAGPSRPYVRPMDLSGGTCVSPNTDIPLLKPPVYDSLTPKGKEKDYKEVVRCSLYWREFYRGFEDKEGRFLFEGRHLFNLINDLPTLFDIVTGRKAIKEKSSANNSSKNKGKPDQLSQARPFPKEADEDSEDDEEEDEHSEATCGSCGKRYTADEFWICCDSCERWFHGKCVKVTPARAEHLKQYKCPSCSKRART